MNLMLRLLVFTSLVSLVSSGLVGSAVSNIQNTGSNCAAIKQKPRHIFRRAAGCSSVAPPLEVSNASVDLISKDMAKVTCDPGFLFPDLTSVRTLRFDGRTWGALEDCVEIVCPRPVIQNAMINGTDPVYRHASMITVTCDTGYALDDATDSYTAECTKCLIWNNTETCKIQVCGSVVRSNTQLYDGRLPDLPYNSTLNVECLDNYITFTGQKIYQSYCEAGAVWNHSGDCLFAVTSCVDGGFTTSSLGAIQSPNFPDNYINFIDNCNWTIEAPENQRIKLTFVAFDVERHSECIYDDVTINDLETSLKICGDCTGYSYISTSNEIIIQFKTDLSVTPNGFQIIYTFVEPPTAEPVEPPDGCVIVNP